MALHRSEDLVFFSDLIRLAGTGTIVNWFDPLRKIEWEIIVPEARLRHDANPSFGGPEAVLAYLSSYTHRVAVSNQRFVSADGNTVAFRWKDYRIKCGDRMKVMRLATHEFIRRFLMHVLPGGFHRIRHYGLLASAQRKANIAKVRALIGASAPEQEPSFEDDPGPHQKIFITASIGVKSVWSVSPQFCLATRGASVP